MTNNLTAQELLELNPDSAITNPTLGIESNTPLKGHLLEKVIELFYDDDSLAGVQVLNDQGEALGMITIEALLDYHARSLKARSRGGSPDQMEGRWVSEFPLFHCDAHEPTVQRLVYYASPTLLRCPTCGQQMKRVR
ncbi:MAG: zinc ribbon domain-containing protein [Gammaproteobacteria bacterium]|nr:zinc ribbon domain-containing protein [Gammaproteobacteria bacterium]